MLRRGDASSGRTRYGRSRRGTQQAVAAAVGAGIVAGGLVVGLLGAHRTQMVPLASSLSSADAVAVSSLLEDYGVPHEVVDGGTVVLVPVRLLDAARVEIVAAGLPAAAQIGFVVLDDKGLTSQQFSVSSAAEAESR